MIDIVILGGGIAGIKLASLLTTDRNIKANITLISSSKEFLFLPLLPNKIENKYIKQEEISSKFVSKSIITNIEKFCEIRNIRFMNASIDNESIHQRSVIAANEKLSFDYLIDARGGYSGIGHQKHGNCQHQKWIAIYRELENKKDWINLEKAGIAEYEVIASLSDGPGSFKKKIYIKNNRNFCTHPQLRNVKLIQKDINNIDRFKKVCENKKAAKINNREKILQYKRIRSDIAGYFPLGACAAQSLGEVSTAQFASFTAYQMYLAIRLNGANIQQSKAFYMKRILRFKQRGKMLYTGRSNAIIWIGEDQKMNKKPLVNGWLASIVRKQFYDLQLQLFYSDILVPHTRSRLYMALKNTINKFDIVF